MWIGAPSIQSRTIFLPTLGENHLFMSVTFGPVPLHFGSWASPTLLRHQASQHHQCPPRNPLHRWLLIWCPNQNFPKNHNTHSSSIENLSQNPEIFTINQPKSKQDKDPKIFHKTHSVCQQKSSKLFQRPTRFLHRKPNPSTEKSKSENFIIYLPTQQYPFKSVKRKFSKEFNNPIANTKILLATDNRKTGKKNSNRNIKNFTNSTQQAVLQENPEILPKAHSVFSPNNPKNLFTRKS
jgi:hypothetical protein